MEIVPILSTIILVGTVATFILAVAAYILYKMREGGVGADGDVNQQVEPHHVVMAVDHGDMAAMHGGDSGPSETPAYFVPSGTSSQQGFYREDNKMYNRPPGAPADMHQPSPDADASSIPLNSFFWEYTEDGFSPIDLQTNEPLSPQEGMVAERDAGTQ